LGEPPLPQLAFAKDDCQYDEYDDYDDDNDKDKDKDNSRSPWQRLVSQSSAKTTSHSTCESF
jgi:hypothetical protein